jgi:phage terminase large subunit-like protein
LWASREANIVVPDGASVAGGFDGSESGDWSALRLETKDGHRFTPTYGPDKRPTVWNPAEWGGQIPRGEVHAAMDEIVRRYKVSRVYCDPRGWQTEIADWALKYGEKMFVEWATYRISQMHAALERLVTDLAAGELTHDGCQITERHMRNARPDRRLMSGEVVTLIRKDRDRSPNKIDMAMSSALAHEAWGDVTTANDWPRKRYATAQFI